MKIRKSLRVFVPWVVTATVGAAVALLAAPQSGRRTRRQIILLGERCWYSATDKLQATGDLLAAGKDEAGRRLRSVGREWRLTSKIG